MAEYRPLGGVKTAFSEVKESELPLPDALPPEPPNLPASALTEPRRTAGGVAGGWGLGGGGGGSHRVSPVCMGGAESRS